MKDETYLIAAEGKWRVIESSDITLVVRGREMIGAVDDTQRPGHFSHKLNDRGLVS